MGFGGFYKGEKKKSKKNKQEKLGQKTASESFYIPPQVEIIGKGKKKDWV